MNTFSDYEAAALSTAVYPGQGGPLGLMYVSLKGAGEAGEFAQHLVEDRAIPVDLLKKEIGDELWYCAAKARELGTTLGELLGTDVIETLEDTLDFTTNSVRHLALVGAAQAGQFAEQVGKAIRDDGMGAIEINAQAGTIIEQGLNSKRVEQLSQLLVDHVEHLVQKARALDTSLAEIGAANIAKLQDRKTRGVLGGSGDNR